MVAAAVLAAAVPVRASPPVDLDDPVYDELARLRAIGAIGAYGGGVLPLSQHRIAELLRAAGTTVSEPASWWVRPISFARIRAAAARVSARPYSTPVRPRNLIGAIDVSCEHLAGRACGDGVGLATDVEAQAGFGAHVDAQLRVTADVGSEDRPTGAGIDRAALHGELGPLAVVVGRDVLAIGPRSRTQLAWGDQAAPLDQVRIATARPFALAGTDGSALRLSVLYAVGRLRAPQTFPGTLVTIARAQADILDNVEVGMGQQLELEGDGARHLGVWDFVLEHIRRGDASAGPTDSSNRRIHFDVAFRIAAFAGARFYYQIVFEDWRKHFLDAMRFDADHVAGVELAALGDRGRDALTVELQATGIRSQEHVPRLTGFTNAGGVVGSPLGPDALSVFARMRLARARFTAWPWLEIARLSSDTYAIVTDGPISLTGHGVTEQRLRAGTRVRIPLGRGLAFDAEALAERVSAFAFVAGDTRWNAAATIGLTWQPGAPWR